MKDIKTAIEHLRTAMEAGRPQKPVPVCEQCRDPSGPLMLVATPDRSLYLHRMRGALAQPAINRRIECLLT
jgi:hypothetical protein